MADTVADGTEWGSDEWYEARWRDVPPALKQRIVDHLRKLDNFEEIALSFKHDENSHFASGMAVRNYLRGAVEDFELPPAPYPYGKAYSNWDDYYVQAVLAAGQLGDGTVDEDGS